MHLAVLAAKASALLRRSADDMAALLHDDFVYVKPAATRSTRLSALPGVNRVEVRVLSGALENLKGCL